MQIFVLLFTLNFTTLNELSLSRDTVIIDSVPFVQWHYGCAPTAASMILWYWDYRDYGRLVDFFFDEWDLLEQAMDYNLPNVIRELHESNNILIVTNWINGYNFGSQTSPQGNSSNQYMFSWIKNEIDNGRPFVWYVLNYWYSGMFINHCLCGTGYIIAPPDTFVVVINSWNGNVEAWPLWTYNSGVYSRDYVVTVVPGGRNPDNIFTTFPIDSGIIFQYGDTVDIIWDSYGSEINYVKIWFASTYDSIEWTLIDSCAPNTGIYTWIVPAESLCARINLQAFNVMDSLEAADGSYYSFRILPTGIAEQNLTGMNYFFNVYPSIFNDRLTIEFAPSSVQPMTLEIYDISGRVIKTLSRPTSDVLRPTYVYWNASDDKNKKVSSDVYFISLRQANQIETKKVIYLPLR